MTSTTLLVRHPLYPDRLVARPCRRVDRLVARLLAPTLDRRLADGCPPEGDRLLATRAQVLVADDNRRAVAANWERLLWAARHPAGHHRGVTLCRHRIIEAEPAAREMIAALTTALPLPARGVAMAGLLLRDGTGPLYNRTCPTDLVDALREVSDALNPTASLAVSA